MSESFLGTGWSFPPTFPLSKRGVLLVSDEEDIRQSLTILLTTTIGERLMQPTYGCDLKKYLFEPLNTGLVTYLRDLVRTAILYHEPRITLDSLEVNTTELDGLFEMHLEYTIRSTNSRSNLVFPFYRDEGGNSPA